MVRRRFSAVSNHESPDLARGHPSRRGQVAAPRDEESLCRHRLRPRDRQYNQRSDDAQRAGDEERRQIGLQ